METVTLVDLAPILGIMLGSMLAFSTAIMRYQHVDSTKTRDLVHGLIENSTRENRELIEKSSRENRELIEKSSRENRELIEKSSRENRELIEKVHLELSGGLDEVRGGLGELRERLARIEGYLERWPKPPPYDGAAEAA